MRIVLIHVYPMRWHCHSQETKKREKYVTFRFSHSDLKCNRPNKKLGNQIQFSILLHFFPLYATVSVVVVVLIFYVIVVDL